LESSEEIEKMSSRTFRNSIDTLEEISINNKKIINQNNTIINGIMQLLEETKQVKKINDDQLTELKKPKA